MLAIGQNTTVEIYILSLGTFAAIVQSQQVQGNYEGLPLWISIAIPLSFLGFLSFQFGVWSSAAGTVFQRRDASLKPDEQYPPQGIWDIVPSLTQTLGAFITLFIIAMELTGHHDMVITLFQTLFAKLFRIIGALTQ